MIPITQKKKKKEKKKTTSKKQKKKKNEKRKECPRKKKVTGQGHFCPLNSHISPLVFTPFWRENFLMGPGKKYSDPTIYFPSFPPN